MNKNARKKCNKLQVFKINACINTSCKQVKDKDTITIAKL